MSWMWMVLACAPQGERSVDLKDAVDVPAPPDPAPVVPSSAREQAELSGAELEPSPTPSVEPEPQEPTVSPEPPAEPVISAVPVVNPQPTPEPAAPVDAVPEPTPDSPDGVRRFNGAADALFSDFVSAGAVDYRGFAAARERWDPVFAAVEGLELDGQSRNARRAFWINYYNLRAIRQVAEAGGIASPLDVPGFFDAKKMRVAGLSLTLNEIENRFLRPDPRVHFALVCAARGCPKIRRRGYTAAGVQAELEAATRRAINDGAWLRVKGDTVEVSKIFEWYAEDFGGPDKVGEFIDRYRRQALPEGVTLVYYEYDWSLNGG